MSEERESLGLPPGTTVGRYRLRQVHAEWGFYLAYLAEETGTGRLVLVHELLPEELVQRAADGTVSGRTERAQESLAWARERFLAEGRALAACPHPAIQKIVDVFEANGTAYWVTPAEEGRSFKQWLQDLGHAPTEAELRPCSPRCSRPRRKCTPPGCSISILSRRRSASRPMGSRC